MSLLPAHVQQVGGNTGELADADLTRLERAERAYHRNQDALCHKVTQADQRIATLTALIGDIDTAISRRTDTRGDVFTMTMDGIRYTKRTDAGRRLQQLAVQMEGALLNSSHRRLEKRSGELGGFAVSVTVERVLGSMNVIMVLDGAPGTEVRMTPAEIKATDPGKLIIRLENRLSGLESLRSRSVSEIDQLTTEAAHARDDIARPFPKPTSSPPPVTVSSAWRRNFGRPQRPRGAMAMTGCSQRRCTMQRSWQGFPVRLSS